MKTWTVHTKPGRNPVLLREGFSGGAFLFGPLWFAAHRAWVPALLHAALVVLLVAFAPGRGGAVVLVAVAVLAGLLGRDVLRWALELRGYTLMHVLAARDEDGAMARLLTYRPEIAAEMAGRLA